MSHSETDASEPHTPRIGGAKWDMRCPELGSPTLSLSVPSSPETPLSPASPTSQQYCSFNGQVIVADLDSPKSILRSTNSLSRQASLKQYPEKVGNLTLTRLVGSGSFSKTYEARGPGGTYAVKTRRSSTDPKLFLHESHVLSKLMRNRDTNAGSDCVVRFYAELSITDNLVFQLYESSLESLVLSSRFRRAEHDPFDSYDFRVISQPFVGLARWLCWAHQLIQGLTYIHSQHIVHGDLKPDNILMTGDKLVISDFSGAIDLEESSTDPPSPQDDSFAWSPTFTDPEVRGRSRTPSQKSDVYSLGLVLAYCATGQAPYGAAKNTTQRLLWMDKVEPLDSFELDVQPRLSKVRPVLARCLTRSLDGIEPLLNEISA